MFKFVDRRIKLLKKINIMISILLFLLIIPCYSIYGTDQIRPSLAVMDFENHSQVNVAGLEKNGLLFLESCLYRTEKFSLIDRGAIKKLLEGFQSEQAPDTKDSQYYHLLSRMLGARYFANGSIVNLNSKVIDFEGYNIHTSTLNISMTVSLRIVDVKEGTVFFVGEVKMEEKIPIIGSTNQNLEGFETSCQDLLRIALTSLVKDLTEKVEGMKLSLPEINNK